MASELASVPQRVSAVLMTRHYPGGAATESPPAASALKAPAAPAPKPHGREKRRRPGERAAMTPASLARAMADRRDLEFTYSLIDRIFRLSLGELADFSGAKYDGDFSMTLEEAQRRKHDYVAEQIGI